MTQPCRLRIFAFALASVIQDSSRVLGSYPLSLVCLPFHYQVGSRALESTSLVHRRGMASYPLPDLVDDRLWRADPVRFSVDSFDHASVIEAQPKVIVAVWSTCSGAALRASGTGGGGVLRELTVGRENWPWVEKPELIVGGYWELTVGRETRTDRG